MIFSKVCRLRFVDIKVCNAGNGLTSRSKLQDVHPRAEQKLSDTNSRESGMWCRPVVPTTQEAESGESLELMSWRLVRFK